MPANLIFTRGHYMETRFVLSLTAGFQLLACSRIEVNIKSKKPSEEAIAPRHSLAELPFQDTKNLLDGYLNHLDELKKYGVSALLKLYHEDGRNRTRSGFRHFRDAVTAESLREESTSPWAKLQPGDCMDMPKTDIFELGAYGDLRSIIDLAFLQRLKVTDAAAFNPELPGQLSAITKLAFFEFGINIDGQSIFEETADVTTMGTDVEWKVIHEKGEPDAWQAADELGVKFNFTRKESPQGGRFFALNASVGSNSDPHEGVPVDQSQMIAELRSRPAMSLAYQGRIDGSQHLFLKKGLRFLNDTWDDIKVSRRISLLQNLESGQIITVIETRQFNLPGENSRSFEIDLVKDKICAILERGHIELPRSPEDLTRQGSPINVPDRPAQNGL